MNATKQLRWDTIFSTYWWQIELDPSHPQNKTNRTLDGYSRADGHTENQDPHQLLMRKVLMFVNRGYLQRSIRIKIFKRRGSFIDKTVDPLVLILEQNDFEIHATAYKRANELGLFLKKVYNDVMKGNPVDYLLPKPKAPNKTVHLDDKLNPDKYYNIHSMADLQILCTNLKAQGFTDHQVIHFYRKFSDKLERQKCK